MRSAAVFIMLLAFNLSASENLSDHEQLCQQAASKSCAYYLEQQLSAFPTFSYGWYRVKGFQLDYMYDQHQFLALQVEAELLLQQQTLPDMLKVQVYFYYAKTLLITGEAETAKHYADKAMLMLQEVYAVFGNPLRIIELANLQYSLGELEQAEQLLNQVQLKYQKSKDSLYLFELYSNKALISHQRDKLDEAAQYRAEALNAAIAMGHNNKIIVAMGNLARTQQLLGQLQAAFELYEQSLAYTSHPEYQVQHAIHLVRLTEICLQQQQPAQALTFYTRIDPQLLGTVHKQLYQEFGKALVAGTADK
ncbi:Tetratricopeptide repeat-containing protein [Arsukibacterium tuosuense]|uniref:Tetratricopeptide repeat-containing protein n=1 Tax=Arsukibacterium tuosuense TaxID=1323745 RepID=A0A285J4A4_9GAMM|nr:tetratricopeptide repeat protein [Arsukibacterium tuosuense]SNY55114.1 Tetratricopeptide repeat-containing protein [Arsukibacterium tuosuense]